MLQSCDISGHKITDLLYVAQINYKINRYPVSFHFQPELNF